MPPCLLLTLHALAHAQKLQPESQPLRAILEESGSIKSDLLEVVRDWRLVDTSTAGECSGVHFIVY